MSLVRTMELTSPGVEQEEPVLDKTDQEEQIEGEQDGTLKLEGDEGVAERLEPEPEKRPKNRSDLKDVEPQAQEVEEEEENEEPIRRAATSAAGSTSHESLAASAAAAPTTTEGPRVHESLRAFASAAVSSASLASLSSASVDDLLLPSSSQKSYDYLLKVLLVGDSDVGKQEILAGLDDGITESPFCSSTGGAGIDGLFIIYIDKNAHFYISYFQLSSRP